MCWTTRGTVESKIAEEDIKTLKIVIRSKVRKDVLLPYFISGGGFYYTLNKITPKINIKVKKVFSPHPSFIDEGYHSYTRDIKYVVRDRYIDVHDNGVYSMCFGTLCIVECLIPKGTKYYLNEYNEYVSEQLMLTEILEEHKLKELCVG